MAVDPGESATRESERGEGKKRDRIKRERGAEAAGEKKQRDETEGKVSSLSRARAGGYPFSRRHLVVGRRRWSRGLRGTQRRCGERAGPGELSATSLISSPRPRSPVVGEPSVSDVVSSVADPDVCTRALRVAERIVIARKRERERERAANRHPPLRADRRVGGTVVFLVVVVGAAGVCVARRHARGIPTSLFTSPN